jgi:hypothetical protein
MALLANIVRGGARNSIPVSYINLFYASVHITAEHCRSKLSHC